ncbi:GNAT family N-acetyltransferase [Micromonospora sp. NPDC002296]|uniref:GNAT family N-acetyltransferase n=1 Tax=Micromonospora sp. NPDC002296 TaxID=3154271 RepID=UPI00332E0DF4
MPRHDANRAAVRRRRRLRRGAPGGPAAPGGDPRADPPAGRRRPRRRAFGALLAEVDGVPVGLARTGLLHGSAEPGLGFVNLAVRPDRRGRGAGSALLAAAGRRLAGLGVRRAYATVAGPGQPVLRHAVTVNDAGNDAMLGLNTWLGYRPVADQWRCRRDLRW